MDEDQRSLVFAANWDKPDYRKGFELGVNTALEFLLASDEISLAEEMRADLIRLNRGLPWRERIRIDPLLL